MKNAVLFQSIISTAATIWSLMCGKIDNVALQHLQATIRLHAEAIHDEISASTDANILSALFITANIMGMGYFSEAEQHLNGVNHLVELRGGLQYLGMEGIVASYVMYADHSQSIFFNKPPMWTMPLPSLKIQSSFAPRSGSGFQAMHGSQILHEELLAAAQDVCRLADLLDMGARGKVPPQELNAVGYLSTVAEYQLAHLNALYHSTATRSECVCLGLILFDHIVMRNAGVIHPAIRKIENQFWTAFQAAEARGCWDIENACLLIWILLTGLTVMVRSECSWKSYAIDCLRKARSNFVLQDWDHVRRSVLDPFVWSEMAQDEVFREIWTQTENQQISEVHR